MEQVVVMKDKVVAAEKVREKVVRAAKEREAMEKEAYLVLVRARAAAMVGAEGALVGEAMVLGVAVEILM